MKLAPTHIIAKTMIAFLAVQVINLSVNTLEFTPVEQVITLGDFNYFNSFAEYVSEVIMDAKDAFPEFQKETSSKTQIVKHLSIKLFQAGFCFSHIQLPDNRSTHIIPLKEGYNYLYCNEINPPPPKA